MDREKFRLAVGRWVESKGPQDPSDYPQLTADIAAAYRAMLAGELARSEILDVLDGLGAPFSMRTTQGYCLHKPHGYAGDYEMIDKIYVEHISEDSDLANWDHFFHAQQAPKAVRNRKAYFHRILDGHAGKSATVLKLGVGPGRGMYEWLSANPAANIAFECVDEDKGGIAYAVELNRHFLKKIAFYHRASLFKFSPGRKYDLIWASGLFDYFDETTFVAFGKRFIDCLAESGEMVIGNFSTNNPSRPYMEVFGDWVLHHRSPESLRDLALVMGVSPENIRVDAVSDGVNLFLRVKKSRD